MLDKDTMEKIKLAQQLNQELYEQGFISVKPYDNEVLMRTQHFHETFEDYAVESRESFQYPLEISKVEDGVKFVAVLDNREAINEMSQAKEREAV